MATSTIDNPLRPLRDVTLDDRRVRDMLLVALTVSTGAVDAVSWLGLDKVFSAFMTGNLVFLGLGAAGSDAPSPVRVLCAVIAFGVGAFLGARLVRATSGAWGTIARTSKGSTWPRGVTVTLGATVLVEAAFLVGWAAVGGHPSTVGGDLLILVSALAMGLQTAAVFSLGVRAVFTTAVTATWAVLMGDVASWKSTREERRRLASVLIGLVAGATAGGLLVLHARTWAPALPLVVTGVVVVVAERVPWAAGGGREEPARMAAVDVQAASVDVPRLRPEDEGMQRSA
jgi:uncharacterized membrane protein YoaK (UPF0700 family)